MKIAQVDEAVERGNTGMEKTFKIQANSRAFQILSSNLYANKIKAVIRELSCNALDSHVAAGRADVPFDVHLPSSMEPYFSVQDYGLGLSHDQVMNIYTTYFDSNKTGTNDLIGGLGLGSKSPFSYANSFDVISTHDGVARSYAMFFNEAGHPSVVFMGEVATSASNGVRINMPVKPMDFDAFRENAQEVFQWFSHPPVVSGNSRYSLPKVEISKTLGGENWQLLESNNSRYHRNNRPTALMGNVAYPLKADSIDRKYSQLLQWPVLIKFGIGELDVSASREDLSYDPITVNVIELRLAAILADLQKVMEQKFVECKSLWEARILMRRIESDYVMSDIMRTLRQAGFSPQFQEGDVGDYAYISWNSVLDKNSKNHPRLMNVSATSRGKVIGHVDADARTVFVLKDVHNAAQRCREEYYKKNSLQRVILIEGGEGWNALECAVVPLILAHLGNPPTILASSLAAPPKRVMQFKGTPWTGGASTWRPRKMDNWGKEISLTTDQGGYYVTIEGSTPVKAHAPDPVTGKIDDYSEVKLGSMISHAMTLGILPQNTTVIGLNKTNTKLVRGVKNWVEITEFVKSKLTTLMTTHNVADLVKRKTQLETINHKFYDNAASWHTRFHNHDGVMGKFVKEWLRVAKTMDKKVDVAAMRQLCVTCGVTWDQMDVTSPNDLGDLYDQVQTKYPLIQKFLRDWVNSDDFKLFTDYVNLIDTVTK